ncbi:spore germination protein [Bacillus sp. S/N-304-OC-R1]|uniref:spore germination protein n=1 Tax=Bacillus sp. S/N-304-OC-R1 TaxID=2758034 RepID=UPI001C8D44F5|nr:spore germination protein [Bacillus sp. S/N-304-OC-R1]MBY0120971.1 spore germination protein [Bacillus sp. S/N-304-OC-R1]
MQDLTKEPNTNNFLNKSFHLNIETLHSIYNHCSDVIFREFIMFGNKKAAIIYIEGLSDVEGIEKSVLLPLMQESSSPLWTVNEILNEKLFISKWEIVQTFEKCIESISTGNPILLLEDEDSGISLGLSKWDKRSIEEPQAEGSIRGPREGFVESIGINTSLIRRIIKSPSLKIQTLKVGTYTNTSVAIVYIEGIIDQTLIEELNNRIKRIKIDGILESEYIEELIEDNPYSPFPQILSTERPDIVCANLLEGRFAVLIDGTPFCLIAPISFFSLIQSQEDYYQRFIISTFIRWLRYLFLGASLLFPSFYVAITTFHQEMVPTALLLSVAAARENVPFPAFVEVLLMEITFEALREAGIRLPKQVGAAVSIVGALVIGQAAVQAGLVSAPMVIVVAITGIASFMIPRYISGIAIRIIRFPIIFLAGTLGLLGIMMSILAILIHLSTLRSFGEPYLAPLAPLKPKELKDLLWRAPLWKMDTRPHLTGETNTYRQIQGQKPGPDKGEN